WKSTDRSLTTEHHRIRTIQYRVSYVIHFSSCRTRRCDHAFQHLGCNDYWLRKVTALLHDDFLYTSHYLHRHFHTEVTTSHHHRVSRFDDCINILNSFGLFDLSDNFSMATFGSDDLFTLANILCRTYERHRDPVST